MSSNLIDMDCPCQGKYLDKMLQPSILMILSKESLHGFEIIKRLSDLPLFSGEEPDYTGVYRYLKRMEEKGLLTSEMADAAGDRKKRVYSIAEKGLGCLDAWSVALKQYLVLLARTVDELDEAKKEAAAVAETKAKAEAYAEEKGAA